MWKRYGRPDHESKSRLIEQLSPPDDDLLAATVFLYFQTYNSQTSQLQHARSDEEKFVELQSFHRDLHVLHHNSSILYPTLIQQDAIIVRLHGLFANG